MSVACWGDRGAGGPWGRHAAFSRSRGSAQLHVAGQKTPGVGLRGPRSPELGPQAPGGRSLRPQPGFIGFGPRAMVAGICRHGGALPGELSGGQGSGRASDDPAGRQEAPDSPQGVASGGMQVSPDPSTSAQAPKAGFPPGQQAASWGAADTSPVLRAWGPGLWGRKPGSHPRCRGGGLGAGRPDVPARRQGRGGPQWRAGCRRPIGPRLRGQGRRPRWR